MNTEPQTVYFLGGPADLSKRVLPNVRNGDIHRLPAFSHIRTPLDASEEATRTALRIEEYRIRQLQSDLWVAIHQPAD